MDPESGHAPPHPSLHLNWLTLAFAGPNAHLEGPFLEDYVGGSLPQLRVALLLGAALYGLFGFLDHLLFPQQEGAIWIIRFAIVCPFLLLLVALSTRPWFPRWMQALVALGTIAAGTGITAMILLLPHPAGLGYYPGLILVLIFSYTFVHARFIWAITSGTLVVLAFETVALWLADTTPVLVLSGFFVIGANLACAATCYGMEYNARRSFHLRALLDEEQHKVRVANQLLETRVEERTAELQQANSLLNAEMAERLRADEERTRLQHQLKQAEKLETIGKLAAGVAHDLNNMLVGLVGLPDLLLLDLDPDTRMHNSIVTIREAGLKAAAVVQDLLTLARQSASETRVLQLNRLVAEHLRSPEHLEMQRKGAHVTLAVSLQEDLLNVRGSPVHLTKALMNLLHNAYEANFVAGTVGLSTRNVYIDAPLDAWERIPEGEYVALRVEDSGTGISSEDLRHIFEPFFSKKKLGRSGTGLGMTLILAAVKEHQGFLDLRSTEGVGTTFDIYLPATRDIAEQMEAHPTLEDCRGSERVAVIDDVPEQREVAVQMLRKLGYEAWAAAGGEEAIERLRESPVDILVLDMVMDPGIDGCETYRRVLTEHPGQRAVIASGFSDSERVREAQLLGAGEYIRKPFTLERLARAIRLELDRKRDESCA